MDATKQSKSGISLSKVAAALAVGGAVVAVVALVATRLCSPPTAARSGFHNDETWDISYDDEGNITKVHVSRMVEPSG